MSFLDDLAHIRELASRTDAHYHKLIKQNELVIRTLYSLNDKLETIMSALDNLKTSVADLATTVNDGVAEIEALLAKITAPSSTDADVQAAADQIGSIAKAIKDEVAKAKAVTP